VIRLRFRLEAARPAAARLAFVFLLVAASALPAAAQTRLDGRVVRDGRGVAGVAVQLHRVTRDARGQIDSTVSGADGRFAMTLPRVDSAAGFTVFFTTAIAGRVRYFGPAVHPEQATAGYEIAVFDTTSSAGLADSVRIARRDLFLIPDMNGTMQVAEIVRVRNAGQRTLVSESQPRISIQLPPGAENFEAGEGDRADSTRTPDPGMARVGDRAWFTDPLVPGDRDFVFRYRLSPQTRRLPVALGRATDSLFVYVRQPAPDVKARGLGEGVAYSAEGERFIRFAATGVRANADASLDWRGPAPPPVDPRWAALAVAGVILAIGAVVAVRRGRASAG
jgi:hypothetical protein